MNEDNRIQDSLLEWIDVPVMVISGNPWVVSFANRSAKEWISVKVGDPLSSSLKDLNQERLISKLQRGREAIHEQKTDTAPSFRAQFIFKNLSDGTVMVEGRNVSALDEAEAMISSYSQLIEKHKKEIELEKANVEKLLLNILPRKIMEDLRQFGRTVPDRFDNVTVLFLDFVGFTELSNKLSADELFRELNDLFTAFDEIVTRHECERIKTIGDAYLAVCGMPEPNPNHAEAIVQVALEMRTFVKKRNKESKNYWSCRIGIHSGSVTAGVVGKLKYIYDIFGDGVNTASRMEAHADQMQINISSATRKLLSNRFKVEDRGPIRVKGKGMMEMYFVHDL
jgi:adenylate cyclase